MAILRVKELREMSLKDLLKKEEELRKELLRSQTQKTMGMVPENPGRIKELKRTIARIKFVIGEKKRKRGE